ncbi:MAG: hypothetical protein ACXVCN_19930 [Bdellovibrio sp.]
MSTKPSLFKTKLLLGFLCTISLISCNLPKPDEFKPDFKFDPEIEKMLAEMSTCDKKDSELNLNGFDASNTFIVKDKIENKDIVEVDCNGHQTPKGHGPVRDLNQFLTVEAPADQKEKINFVLIENSRTCSSQKIDAVDDKNLEKQTIAIDDKNPLIIDGPTSTTLGESGKLKILLSSVKVKIAPLFLNVHEGNNVVKITYYGKCLKYKDNINKDMPDSYNCSDAEVLAEKQILVSVQIEHPEGQGTQLNNKCTK